MTDLASQKRYDRAYFDRWYRSAADRIDTRESLERKVRLAVSAAEYLLGRRIRRVLDVGCGEARWQPILRRLRPDADYQGVESSEYALERYGESRNIRRGTLAGLSAMRIARDWDLVVCADVLQYVSDRDALAGLRAIRRLAAGVAYVEAFAREDAMEGDEIGWHQRSAAAYRRMFRAAGLTHCGFYCWVDARRHPRANVFELGG